MWAAAAGHSNLGIPSAVGKEFSQADPGGKLPAKAKDLAPGKWSLLKRLFGEWIDEEQAEPENAAFGETEDQQQPGERRAENGTGAQETGARRAASVAFTTADGRVLFVKRSSSQDNWPDTWALPGGKAEDGETDEQCASREAREEIGDCSFDGMKAIDQKQTPQGLDAHDVRCAGKGAFRSDIK